VRRAAEQLGARTQGSGAGAARAAQGAACLRCPYVLTGYFGLIVSAIAETLALHGRRGARRS
jgi:LacI family transcriptional regulator